MNTPVGPRTLAHGRGAPVMRRISAASESCILFKGAVRLQTAFAHACIGEAATLMKGLVSFPSSNARSRVRDRPCAEHLVVAPIVLLMACSAVSEKPSTALPQVAPASPPETATRVAFCPALRSAGYLLLAAATTATRCCLMAVVLRAAAV